jgi:pimeloyl-ACP methyl ester carboxylesterase
MDDSSVEGNDEGLFQGARGQKLYYQRRTPAGPVRAALAVVRGSGEFSDLYACIVTTLAPRGFAVSGFDHRDHTRRPGQRGYLDEWSLSQQDVHAFVELVIEQAAELPIFLVGNGLGGLIVLTYALRNPGQLTGVVAFGPAPVEAEIIPLLSRVGRNIAGIWPALPPAGKATGEPVSGAQQHAGHEVIASGDEAAVPADLLGEEMGATVGELAIPHLIVRRTPGRPAPPDSAPDDANYRRLLADLEAWLLDCLRGDRLPQLP